MIQKSIKLYQPDHRTGGCRGSADFGLLNDAVAKLGTELGLNLDLHKNIQGQIAAARARGVGMNHHVKCPLSR